MPAKTKTLLRKLGYQADAENIMGLAQPPRAWNSMCLMMHARLARAGQPKSRSKVSCLIDMLPQSTAVLTPVNCIQRVPISCWHDRSRETECRRRREAQEAFRGVYAGKAGARVDAGKVTCRAHGVSTFCLLKLTHVTERSTVPPRVQVQGLADGGRERTHQQQRVAPEK